MRISTSILALGALLASAPTLAQVSAGGTVSAGTGINAGGSTTAAGRIVSVTDRIVSVGSRTVNGGLANGVRVASRTDLRTGAEVRDSNGVRLGTVQSLHGNRAVIVNGSRAFHVPFGNIYRSTLGLVTDLSTPQLQTTARIHVKTKAKADR
jgi:hypothetical protein